MEVPDWGVRLETASPVEDGLKAVGIRAHYFNAKSSQNRAPVTFVREMEEPFEWIVEFRFAGQKPDTAPPVVGGSPRTAGPRNSPRPSANTRSSVGVAPQNVLLLYQ